MNKKLIIQSVFIFLVTTIHAIGVRQLQEFNDAKKEVEKMIHSSEPLSDEAYKKFEKNLSIIASVDKNVADTYKAQIASKKSNITVEKTVESIREKKTESSFKKEVDNPVSELPKISTFEESQVVESHRDIELEPETPRKPETITPVFNTQSPLETIIPVRTSSPEERQTPVFNTQAFDVPISKEQREKENNQEKQKIITQLGPLEDAVYQVERILIVLKIDKKNGFINQKDKFQKWDTSINKYTNVLKQLESVDERLYEEKMERVKNIQKMLLNNVIDQVCVSIELMRDIIDPLVALLKVNEDKKKRTLLFVSDDTEFNKLSYAYFFGSISNMTSWKSSRTRKNFEWFKGNYQQSMQAYWMTGIEQYFDLLFQYHNVKQIVARDNLWTLLKGKMIDLKEKIGDYKKLLSNAYNGMLAVQKSLPKDDVKEQTELLAKTDKKDFFNYENHLKLLNTAQSAITQDFLYKLWPEEAPNLM